LNKTKEIIHSLNQLVQGEYMSIKAFNIYISKLKDESIKRSFQEVQNQHRENIKYLTHYIQDLGGLVNENTGFKGTMSELKINMQASGNIEPSDYIKKAIEGMIKGVNMTENLLRGDLDDSSRKLVGEILENDRNSIELLRTLNK
jgi:bacterioferritin